MIGLVGAQIPNRTGGKVTRLQRRAIEKKESYRWLPGKPRMFSRVRRASR
ncbi:hypothetical protein [Rhodopila globiformis]|nr:hypothetical protein [Rhodopila globiformis]